MTEQPAAVAAPAPAVPAERLHIGAGGAGLSTGAGPFSAYRSLRSGRRHR